MQMSGLQVRTQQPPPIWTKGAWENVMFEPGHVVVMLGHALQKILCHSVTASEYQQVSSTCMVLHMLAYAFEACLACGYVGACLRSVSAGSACMYWLPFITT